MRLQDEKSISAAKTLLSVQILEIHTLNKVDQKFYNSVVFGQKTSILYNLPQAMEEKLTDAVNKWDENLLLKLQLSHKLHMLLLLLYYNTCWKM